MKHSLTLSALAATLALALALAGCAQTGQQTRAGNELAAPVTVTSTGQAEPMQAGDQRIERIHHSDAGGAVDELRVGGETRSLVVTPSRAGAYEINPTTPTPSTSSGQRVWNLLKF